MRISNENILGSQVQALKLRDEILSRSETWKHDWTRDGGLTLLSFEPRTEWLHDFEPT